MALQLSIILLLLLVCFARAEPMQCGQPEVPENGRVIFYSREPSAVGSVITYKCDEDFVLLGAEQRVCEPNGSWSDASPVCAYNVVLYKPAIQSRFGKMWFDANFSTDGKYDMHCNGDADGMALWQVDLLAPYLIYAVEFLIPVYSDSSVPDEIEVSTSEEDPRFSGTPKQICYRHSGRLTANQLHTFVCKKEVFARFIRVSTERAFKLCEVSVFSRYTTSPAQCGTIPSMDTWSYFRGLCYFGSQTVLPWDSAGSQCLINQALLANQIDWPLQFFLTVYLNNKAPREAQNYWIGLSTDVNKDWKWTDGSIPTAQFWATQILRTVNESTSASAATARLYNWRWIPSRQTAWYNWMCQRRPLFCGSPAVPKNGGIMLSNQIYKIGVSAYYYCIYGFVIVGRSVRVCLENGTWSDLPPTCLPVDCGNPRVTGNLDVVLVNESTTVGSVLEYKCNHGRAVQGNTTRVCLADGTWSGSAPTCVDAECGTPPPIEHGKFTLTSNTSAVSSTAQYSCDKDYRLVGISVLNCGPNGLWSPSVAPLCYDLSSLPMSMLPNDTQSDPSHTNIMVAFITAIVVLLIVIACGLTFIIRRRRKFDDSTATNVTNISNCTLPHRPDLLCAFPPVVNAKLPADDCPYYVHTICTCYHKIADDSAASGKTSYALSSDIYKTISSSNLTPIYESECAPVVTSRPQNVSATVTKVPPALRGSLVLLKKHDELLRRDHNVTLPILRQPKRKRPNAALPFTTLHLPKPARLLDKTSSLIGTMRQRLSVSNFNSWFKTDDCGGVRSATSALNRNTPGCAKANTASNGDRPPSPTLSEMFSFDDEEDDDELASSDSVSMPKTSVGIAAPATAAAFGARNIGCTDYTPGTTIADPSSAHAYSYYDPSGRSPSNSRQSPSQSNSKSESIYDFPPDAKAKINKTLADVLLQGAKAARENIYEDPADLRRNTSSTELASQKTLLKQSGIELVQSYC